jgi:hypothetical protein
VDVTTRQLYRAKVKVKQQIEGKHKDRYMRLWDYCATVRQLNRGSTMLMKVEGYLRCPTYFSKVVYVFGRM